MVLVGFLFSSFITAFGKEHSVGFDRVLCYNFSVEKVGKILEKEDLTPSKHIKHEFQHYGYRLACELDDLEHRSLYMKLAKEEPRARLEDALAFVKDMDREDLEGEKSRAKLFMWKLKELREKNALRQGSGQADKTD